MVRILLGAISIVVFGATQGVCGWDSVAKDLEASHDGAPRVKPAVHAGKGSLNAARYKKIISMMRDFPREVMEYCVPLADIAKMQSGRELGESRTAMLYAQQHAEKLKMLKQQYLAGRAKLEDVYLYRQFVEADTHTRVSGNIESHWWYAATDSARRASAQTDMADFSRKVLAFYPGSNYDCASGNGLLQRGQEKFYFTANTVWQYEFSGPDAVMVHFNIPVRKTGGVGDSIQAAMSGEDASPVITIKVSFGDMYAAAELNGENYRILAVKLDSSRNTTQNLVGPETGTAAAANALVASVAKYYSKHAADKLDLLDFLRNILLDPNLRKEVALP